MFLENPTGEIFKQIFDTKELEDISTHHIQVIFSKYNIFVDDTIETIKNKYLLTLHDIESDKRRISYDEMYLFYQEQKQLDATELYQNAHKEWSISIDERKTYTIFIKI